MFLLPGDRRALIDIFPGAVLEMDLETGSIERSIPLATSAIHVAIAWISTPGPPTSPTPEPTRTPEPTFTPCSLACAGDCQLNGVVTVDEEIYITNVALGVARMNDCAAGDIDADCKVTVDEVIGAVANALSGCAEGATAHGAAAAASERFANPAAVARRGHSQTLRAVSAVGSPRPREPGAWVSSQPLAAPEESLVRRIGTRARRLRVDAREPTRRSWARTL
jgi:hypothetical protein